MTPQIEESLQFNFPARRRLRAELRPTAAMRWDTQLRRNDLLRDSVWSSPSPCHAASLTGREAFIFTISRFIRRIIIIVIGMAVDGSSSRSVVRSPPVRARGSLTGVSVGIGNCVTACLSEWKLLVCCKAVSCVRKVWADWSQAPSHHRTVWRRR